MTHSQFKPSAKLTFATVRSDKQRFSAFLEQFKAQELSIDFSHVTHCDSAGLAFVLETKKQCHHQGIALKMVGISAEIQALAKFSGVYNVLSV